MEAGARVYIRKLLTETKRNIHTRWKDIFCSLILIIVGTFLIIEYQVINTVNHALATYSINLHRHTWAFHFTVFYILIFTVSMLCVLCILLCIRKYIFD